MEPSILQRFRRLGGVLVVAGKERGSTDYDFATGRVCQGGVAHFRHSLQAQAHGRLWGPVRLEHVLTRHGSLIDTRSHDVMCLL